MTLKRLEAKGQEKKLKKLNELFGKRLRVRRFLLGLSQVELSKKSGISQSAIAQIELNRKTPTLSTVFKLASALGIEMDAMFLPVEYKEPTNE